MELINIIYGNNLKRLRNEKNLTQEKLSIKSGVERSQISKIESGLIDVQLSTAEKLANALNLSLVELLKIDNSIHPFVKWAGGKTQLLDALMQHLPENFNRYFEPFVGGGALFFKLKPKKAFLNDSNEELMIAFECFKNPQKAELLINKLKEYEEKHSEEFYYEIRSLDRDEEWVKNATDIDIAARFIYLNKACFNGLYRVNSKGFFNVPSGKKTKVYCYDEANLKAIINYFGNCSLKLSSIDFEAATKNAKEGDFVYFDPPYDSYENSNTFNDYSKEGFGKDEQVRLSEVFKKLDKKGVKVMLSNHNTPFINELYKGYKIHKVEAVRIINSNAKGRGAVEEVIITNY